MGQLTIASAGNAQVDIEWRDNNLRINRAHIINNEAHAIAVQVRDITGLLLFNLTYEPGIHEQNIIGAVTRYVEITEVNTGDFEIDINGLSIGLSNPA